MADNETAAVAAPKKRRTKEELAAAGIEKKPTKRVVFYTATDEAGNPITAKINFLKFMTMRDGLGEFVKLQSEYGPSVSFQEFEL